MATKQASKQAATAPAGTGLTATAWAALLAAFTKVLGNAPANSPLAGQGGNAAPCSVLPALNAAYGAGLVGGKQGTAGIAAANLVAATQGTVAASFKAGKPFSAVQGAVGFWLGAGLQAVHGYVVAPPGTAYTCPCKQYTYPVGVTRVVCCANGHKPTVHPALWAAGQVQYGPHLLPAHLQAAAAKAVANGAPAAGSIKCGNNVHGGPPVYAAPPKAKAG